MLFAVTQQLAFAPPANASGRLFTTRSNVVAVDAEFRPASTVDLFTQHQAAIHRLAKFVIGLF
jgi:hypothetical protein